MSSISEPKFTDPVVYKGSVGHDSNANAKGNSTIRNCDVIPEPVQDDRSLYSNKVRCSAR